MNRIVTPFLFMSLVATFLLAGLAMAVDIVHTSDGRVLEGEIVRETDRQIVFRYIDPALGFEATITLPRSTIEKIERNVTPVQEDVAQPDSIPSPKPASTTSDESADSSSQEEPSARDEGATTFYIVPMKGQVGTDITERIYEQIIEDIKEKDPDVVILNLDSSDLRNEYQEGADDIIEGDSRHFDPQEQNAWDANNIRAVRLMFADKLPSDMRQVMWVRDAVGSSAVYALAWPELYMHPEANLGGMQSYVMMYRNAAGDDNVRAKFGDAAFGWIRGITSYGQDPDNPNPTRDKLINAMGKPEAFLSVSWRGRMPIWRNNLLGEFVIDFDEENATVIPSSICDDLCLTDGTAETIEDLAVLLGERQYQLVEGKAEEIVLQHHEDWRAAFDKAVESWKEYQKWMGRASGPSRMGNLRKAENALKRVLVLTKKWPEVGTRSRGFFNETRLEILLEELERIRGQGGGGSGGRGSGGGGGGGLGNR